MHAWGLVPRVGHDAYPLPYLSHFAHMSWLTTNLHLFRSPFPCLSHFASPISYLYHLWLSILSTPVLSFLTRFPIFFTLAHSFAHYRWILKWDLCTFFPLSGSCENRLVFESWSPILQTLTAFTWKHAQTPLKWAKSSHIALHVIANPELVDCMHYLLEST